VITASIAVDPRGPSKIAHCDRRRFIKQASICQIPMQCGQSAIQHRQQFLLQAFKIVFVSVSVITSGI
jgi:hypothetical protein